MATATSDVESVELATFYTLILETKEKCHSSASTHFFIHIVQHIVIHRDHLVLQG